MSSATVLDSIGKPFGIKRGEAAIAFPLFFYLLLVIACYMISKTVRDSLFLSEFDANQLPYLYIGIALGAGLFVSVYLRIARRFRQHTGSSLTLLFFLSQVVLFWWLFHSHTQPERMYPIFYIWAGIFGVIAPMQVWTLSNFILTTREAKRLFGFIGGGVLGGIAGSLFSCWTVSLIGGTENLLLAIAALLAICVFLVNVIWYQSARNLRHLQLDGPPKAEPLPSSLRQSLSQLAQSRYLLLIAGIITISSIVTTMIDYQFKAAADRAYETKDQLTAFFGSFYGYLGIMAFGLQILLTSRLMRNLGIGFTMFLLPAGLFLGSVASLTQMTLWSAILLKGPNQLFKHSVDKTTVELLYLPVPTEIKAAVKSFLDTVVWRLADGIGGVLLLALTTVAALSTRHMTVVTLGLLSVWLIIAYVTKREYLEALRSAVSKQTVDPHKLTVTIQESSTVKNLMQSLDSQDVDELLYVLEMMECFKDKRKLVPKALQLLDYESAEVRVKALKLLSEVGDRRLAERVRRFLNDDSFEVQVAAVEFLCAHAGKDPVEMTQAFLDDPDYRVKGATACFLIISRGDEEYYVVAREVLEKMVHSPDPSARLEAARALGHIRTLPDLTALLLVLLEDPSSEVAQQALQSAGQVQRREFVPLMIAHLGNRETALQARRALVKYGTKVLGTLCDYLLDDQTEMAVRQALPRVISRIGSQLAVDILINHLHEVVPELRLAVIKGLNGLRAQGPELRFDAARIRKQLVIEAKEYYQTLALLHAYNPTTRLPAPQRDSDDLLHRSLEEKAESVFERTFRLLGLIYPPEDLHQAYYGTLSPEATVKANALELLDNLLRTDDKQLALPIADDEITMSGKMRAATSLGVAHIEGRIAALSRLVLDPQPLVVVAALDAIHCHRLESLYHQIEKATCHTDPLVRETALDLWSHIGNGRDSRTHSGKPPLTDTNGQRWPPRTSRTASAHAKILSEGLRMKQITTLEKIKRLQNTLLFAHSRTDQLINIAAIAKEITFHQGEVIFRENDPGDSLFLIVKGKVRLKREATAYETILGEGEAFGTLAILDRKPRLVTATAEEESLVLRIDSEEFYELLADHIEIVQGIFSCLSQQIRKFLQTGELELTGKGGAL